MARRKSTVKNKRVRRRGAPTGNQNARKHGFYSKVYDEEEMRAYELATTVGGLSSEMALVRVKLQSALARDPHNFRIVVEGTNALAKLHTAGMKPTPAEKKSLTEQIAVSIVEERVPMGARREGVGSVTNTTNAQ